MAVCRISRGEHCGCSPTADRSFHVDAHNAAEPQWEEFALSRVAILIHRGLFDTAASELQRLR